MIVRIATVLFGSIALVVLSLRSAAALAPADSPLHAVRPWFPGHAAMIADRAMSAVGLAAREGRELPPAARRDLADLARKEPLRPEPFLVAGASAQLAGDAARSERLFVAARDRHPRSAAARFMLADRLLRTGRIEAGLVEMAVLARLQPKSAQPFVPAIVAYARTPGAVERLRQFFADSPDMRDPVLLALARDPANAPLVLSLAPAPVTDPPYPEWQGTLLGALVAAGKVGEAERIWARLSGIDRKPLLVNPQFSPQSLPPPFSWTIGSGSAGVAEIRENGGLDLIYYGREPFDLARQLLVLQPGRYRLNSRVQGAEGADMVSWKITCLDNRALGQVPIGRTGMFAVPQDCVGQNLILAGVPADSPRTVQATLTTVAIEPVP
jgi:hypothetical protein